RTLAELDGPPHAVVDGALRGLQAPFQSVQARPVFDRHALQRRGQLSDTAYLRDEELGRGQVEEYGVDQGVAGQLLVEDEARGITGVRHQRARRVRDRLAQVVGDHRARARELVREGLDVALDGAEALRAVQDRPQLALRPHEDGERLGDLRQLPLSSRLAGLAAQRRNFLFHVFLDTTEHALAG